MPTSNQILRLVSDKTSLSDADTAERVFLVIAFNEGVRQVLLDTRCRIDPVEIALTAGQSEYVLADTLGDGISILAVLDYTNVADNRSTLVVANQGEILARRLWGTVGTARRFAMLGENLLIVQPTPDADGIFTFYATLQPEELADGADDPLEILPSYAYKAVEWWMCIEAMQKNRDSNGVGYYTGLYEREVIKIRKRARQMAGRRIAAGRIGYPERPNVLPADNSQDMGI